MKSNLDSNHIQVFPTQNSRDEGKLVLEENVRGLAWKITKLNYVYTPTTPLIMKVGTDNNGYKCLSITATDPMASNDTIEINIHGYSLKIMKGIQCSFADESADNTIQNNPGYVIVHNGEYGTEIPFGLVLSEMANTDRLKGDVHYVTSSDDSYFYFGLDFMFGSDFESADDEWKLPLGKLTLTKGTGTAVLITDVDPKYNTFIIDASTIGVINEDGEFHALTEVLNNDFVAKKGNNFEDESEVYHDSDIYGSLMFRDNSESEDYRISAGFKDSTTESINEIEVKNDTSNGVTIKTTKNLSTNDEVNSIEIGNYEFQDTGSVLELQDNALIPGEIHVTDIIALSPNLRGIKESAEDYVKEHNMFATLIDEEKAEFIYSQNSLIQIRCDDEVARISFGEYETVPIFLDYDLENFDLSINDKLGAIGVVKYCDGQCVDETEYYSTHDHSTDKTYDYPNPYIPKSYSEQKNAEVYGNYSLVLEYADGSSSIYENVKLDNFIGIGHQYASRSTYPIYTATDLGVRIGDIKYEAYGFYISKDWETDKYFKASAGAFDFNRNADDEPTSITEKSGYEYVELPISASDKAITGTKKFYDYISLKIELGEEFKGNQILLADAFAGFDLYNYMSFNDSTTFAEDYGGILDRNKINAFFCTDRVSGDSSASEVKFGYESKYPTVSDTPISYTLVQTTKQNGTTTSLLNFEDLSGGNCIINVPNLAADKKLYLMITIPACVAIGYSSFSETETVTVDGTDKQVLIYNTNYFKVPDLSISGGNWTKRGLDGGVHGLRWGKNPIKYTVNSADIDAENYVTRFQLDDGTYVNSIPQTGLSSIFYPYAQYFSFTYTTSKSYKSYRIHGYYDAVKIGGAGQTFQNIPSESDVGYGSGYTYQYNCYRIIYELGFEDSSIIVEKITNVTFDGVSLSAIYKLSRKDGKNIIGTACTPYWFNGPNQYPYPGDGKYFYVDNLKKPDKFILTNANYNSGAVIKTMSDEDIANNIYNNFWSSTFYNRTTGNLGKYALKNYTPSPDQQAGDTIWFIRNFTVLHGAGINFNVGQNRFNVNVDAYFNETTHITKIMFGEDDETGTTITPDQARFTYEVPSPVPGEKSEYKTVTIDKNGITFEANPDDITDRSINISKAADTTTEQNPNPFNGLEITGDIRATRVFNAVYNDYADNLKCSKVSEYEPGDIICKEPGTDEYVLGTYDLRRLVVGVYSDTYGHLLGGDKDKSIEENSKNYVPVALAGNVYVKLHGYGRAGDLVELSNIPGVGKVAKSPEIGTIIGKLLEDKDNYETERVLMQVMLL